MNDAQVFYDEAHIVSDHSPLDFKTVVEAHQDRVLNICFKFLRSREDAEDTAQEVFMEVYRSLDGFRGDAQLSTWIHRVAVTKSLDAIRRKKRKKRMGSVRQLIGFDDSFIEPESPLNLRPDKLLEESERKMFLNKAMDKLPENQHIALTLCQIEGFTYQETADIMGTSLSSVESLIFRGKKGLKRHLTQSYEEILD
ncbi:RNA polymerase sigma factor [bacterium]|nr:RNA polymerase sigma factor [bacterium]